MNLPHEGPPERRKLAGGFVSLFPGGMDDIAPARLPRRREMCELAGTSFNNHRGE
jgi:hypothetical protein